MDCDRKLGEAQVKVIQDRMNKSICPCTQTLLTSWDFHILPRMAILLKSDRKLVEDQVNDSQDRINISDCTSVHN